MKSAWRTQQIEKPRFWRFLAVKVGLVVGCPLEKFKELPATAVFQTGQLPKSLCQRDDSAVGHQIKRPHFRYIFIVLVVTSSVIFFPYLVFDVKNSISTIRQFSTFWSERRRQERWAKLDVCQIPLLCLSREVRDKKKLLMITMWREDLQTWF